MLYENGRGNFKLCNVFLTEGSKLGCEFLPLKTNLPLPSLLFKILALWYKTLDCLRKKVLQSLKERGVAQPGGELDSPRLWGESVGFYQCEALLSTLTQNGMSPYWVSHPWKPQPCPRYWIGQRERICLEQKSCLLLNGPEHHRTCPTL